MNQLFSATIFHPYDPIYGGENLTKLFEDRTDRGLNLSSAFQRYTSVNGASEVIEVAGSNPAIRVFLNQWIGGRITSPRV